MKIGFIGCGKMGGALVRGILRADLCRPEEIAVTDIVPAALEKLAGETGVGVMENGVAVSEASDVVVVCVKPGDVEKALRDAGAALKGRLVISIAAGVRIGALVAAAHPGARVVRVMPNTPALVGKGVAAYALGATATADDARVVATLFDAVGRAVPVDEALMDAVTGLSGSGPAFVYAVIEAMADAGVLAGLPRDTALVLAARTVAGAAEMVMQTGQHPAALRDQVTSPGGTTIAGMEALEACGVRIGIMAAVKAAVQRSKELAG